MNLCAILDIVKRTAGYRERSELFPAITSALRAVLRADYYALFLRDRRDAITFYSYVDPPVEQVSNKMSDYFDPLGQTDGRVIIVRAHDVEPWPYHREIWHRQGIKSALRVPIVVENALVGIVAFWSTIDAHEFDNANFEVAKELGTVLAVVIDSCLAYEHLAQLREEAADDNSYLREALHTVQCDGDGMVGTSPAFTAVRRQIEVVAPTDATVLLTGESGTGKDVVARAIHAASARRDRPLVTVNCAAIPAKLAESELFGTEEGAFTGAGKSRAGRFEQADGGTLFLDEVGELPLEVQAKLLRVIQEREVERVGGGSPIRVDVRIIAATNRNLHDQIEADRFREDLFYRLAVFPIQLPPLRARLEDLPLLVDYFVKVSAERFHVPLRQVTPDVIRRLSDHDWPGNVRELQHAIERAMIVSPGEVLAIDTVVPRRIAPTSTGSASDRTRESYMTALNACGWVIEGPNGAAAKLALHPNTLRHRLKRLGIARLT